MRGELWERALQADVQEGDERAPEQGLSDPLEAERYEEERRFNRLLAQALSEVGAEEIWRGVQAGIDAANDSSRVLRAVQRRLPPRSRRGWGPRMVLALAAALLLIWYLLPRNQPPALLQLAEGEAVLIERSGRAARAPLQPGDRLVAPASGAVLGSEAGDHCWLAPGSETILQPPGGDLLQLSRGRLIGSWAKREQSIDLGTGQARVTVLGTRFSLETEAGITRCLLDEGRVRFAAGAAELLLEPGHRALVDKGMIDVAPLPALLVWLDGLHGLKPRYTTPPLSLPHLDPDPAGVLVDWSRPLVLAPAFSEAPPALSIRLLLRPLRAVQGVLPVAVLRPRGPAGDSITATLTNTAIGSDLEMALVVDRQRVRLFINGELRRDDPIGPGSHPGADWQLLFCGGPQDWDREEAPTAYRLQLLSIHAIALGSEDLGALPRR